MRPPPQGGEPQDHLIGGSPCACGTTRTNTKFSSKDGLGAAVAMISSVILWTSTLFTVCRRWRICEGGWFFARRKLATTSSARQGLPLENCLPGREVKRQILGETCFQEAGKAGSSFKVGEKRTSPSSTLDKVGRTTVSLAPWGSRVKALVCCAPTTSLGLAKGPQVKARPQRKDGLNCHCCLSPQFNVNA